MRNVSVRPWLWLVGIFIVTMMVACKPAGQTGDTLMANDFSTDPSCKALWRFESGALFTDSIGTNTLADYDEAVSAATGAGDFREGSASVVVEGSTDYRYPYIDDTNLDAGFPFKSGDTDLTFSLAGWFRFDVDWPGKLFLKGSTFVGQSRTIAFACVYDALNIELELRLYGVATNQTIKTSGAGLVHGQWYHFGLAVDGQAKTYLIRLYDLTAASAQTFSDSFTPDLHTGNFTVHIGRDMDGNLDEFVVFDEAKTADDFDDIRAGTYTYVAPTDLTVANASHTHTAETPFMGTLEVSNANHSLWSPQIWAINLVVANAHHVLTSPALNTVLSVQGAAHVSAAGALTVMHVWVDNYLTNGLLPGIQLTAQTGKRLYLTRPLPGLQLTAWSGAQLSERLPTLEVSATSSHDALLTGSNTLPEMRIEARSASRADALKLPTLEGSATVQAFLTGSLDRRLPGIQITAEGAAARIGVLTGTLPALEASLIATAEILMSLDSHLPVLRGSALASLVTTIDLDALLPALGITGGNAIDGSMSLSGTLPTIMASVMVNTLTEDEPAVEYHILRHVR